jgi:hypothetical protein
MSEKFFDIKSKELVDFTLKLQKINDVALPFAVQNTLNEIVKNVKIRTLKETTEDMFDVKRKTFFTANSGYKTHKAKEFNYNLNKIKAEVGITQARKPHDKATEQVGHQETAKSIKRSINPLGTKPKSNRIIDVLGKKPEIYDYSDPNNRTTEFTTGYESSFNPRNYIRKVTRAKSRGAPFLRMKSGRGTLFHVKHFSSKRRKTRKKNQSLHNVKIKLTPIASYIKGGELKLTKKRPFLTKAVQKTMTSDLEKIFREKTEQQVRFELKRSMRQ